MKAACPKCGGLVPVTFAPGPHPKPTVLATHGERIVSTAVRRRGMGVVEYRDVKVPCEGSGAVDANWRPPKSHAANASVAPTDPPAPAVESAKDGAA